MGERRRTAPVPAATRCLRWLHLSDLHAGWQDEARLQDGFVPFDVRPLDAEGVERLVRQWFLAARLALAVYPGERAGAEARGAREAADLLEHLASPDHSAQRLLTLVSTPLLLTLLCLVVLREGDIPRRRTKFYERCLKVLLGRWREAQGIRPRLAVEDALDLLRPLAWALHAAGRRDDLTAAEFAGHAVELLAEVGRRSQEALEADDVLDWLHRGAGVLADYGQDRYGFSHLGFQEHLAALHAAREGGEALAAVAGASARSGGGR